LGFKVQGLLYYVPAWSGFNHHRLRGLKDNDNGVFVMFIPGGQERANSEGIQNLSLLHRLSVGDVGAEKTSLLNPNILGWTTKTSQ